MIHDPNTPLLSELRWFVHQRWLAGIIISLSILFSGIWIDWTPKHLHVLLLGIVILVYNASFWGLLRNSWRLNTRVRFLRLMAWLQVTLDLACLTLLVMYTGGILSPVLGLYFLHMIFASLLLQSRWFMPYLAWILAVLMMLTMLVMTGRWPESSSGQLLVTGWVGTLLLTIYFTTHITKSVCTNHERTHAVLNAAADAVMTVNQFGHIELVNPAAIKMFGYPSSQLIGACLHTLIPPTDAKHTTPAGQLVSSSFSGNMGNIGKRADGSSFPLEASLSSMKTGAKGSSAVVVRDISERLRNEAELEQLNRDLKAHQNRLVQHEKMIAVGEMASGVAHEIANPLANIDGIIQLIERNPDRFKAETPSQLREQVVRITEIVRQLKDFAHPTGSQRREIGVDEVIESALGMIRFDRRSHHVKWDRDESIAPFVVNIHPQAIQQVLVNLIVNALDAVGAQSDPSVIISTSTLDDGSHKVCITDNGTGISDAHIHQIFEPFFTTKPAGQGTGLGLSISYSLVQHDGGYIEVQSEEGKGTRISIVLPPR